MTLTAVSPERGAQILDGLHAFVTEYMSFPLPEQADAVVLWIAHTHAIEFADATPRLSIQSAEKQSGKTRLLELLDLLVRDPLLVANISAAALFRTIADDKSTLLIDEVDAIFGARGARSEDLRGMLNAGYRKNGAVARMAGGCVERFDVFAPVALAGIGTLPDTVQDRSIVIRLKRRRASERVGKLRRRHVEPVTAQMRKALSAWVVGSASRLSLHVPPELPDVLSDRASDIWEPLFVLAHCAGGDWPARVNAAAVALSTEGTNDVSVGVRLLGAVRVVLADHVGRVTSTDLVAGVRAEDPRWSDLDARELAKLLEPFDVRPRPMRINDKVVRGYEVAPFADLFARYLATEEA